MRIGTPLSASARRVMLLGSGELGKEVVIELQRLGVETIAVDRYPDAPAMQVAHRSHVINMADPAALRALVQQTLLGAARMLVEQGEPADVLRARVTSPGGTTQAAIETFEAGGLRALVDRAIDAATRRGRALSAAND